MTNRPVGAELFHADRQTDMRKLFVAFRKFVNAPQKSIENSVREREREHIFICPLLILRRCYYQLSWTGRDTEMELLESPD